MSKYITIYKGKTLHLENVLIMDVVKVNLDSTDSMESADDTYLNTVIEKMKNEILTKGAVQIGPLIQYSSTGENEDELGLCISFMIQADKLITNVSPPFKMLPILTVKDCMYTRFIGMEEDINFAYQKIVVTAYEEDIKLKGSSYTVFLDSNDDGTIIADIFMERADA